jgi:hypothetical protein
MTEQEKFKASLESEGLTKPSIVKHDQNYRIAREAVGGDIHEKDEKELKDILENKLMTLKKPSTAITNPNTIYGVVNTVMKVLRLYNKPVEKLEVFYKALKVRKENHNFEGTKKVAELQITPKYLESQKNKYYDEGDYVRYILNYLIVNLNVRNEDLDVVLLRSVKNATDETENYLVLAKNSVLYIRRRYKTAKNYGEKKLLIRSKKFVNAVNELLEKGNTYLLERGSGARIQKSSLGKYVNILSIDNLGTAKITKIITSSAVDKCDEKKINQISKTRGTSKTELFKSYQFENKCE